MLLLCLVVLGFGQLCFVRGRRRPVPINKDTRMLTSKIKKAETVPELLDLVDGIVDKRVFDHIHASAAYTKLGNFQKKGQLRLTEVNGMVLARLESRLQGMLVRKEVGAQGLANIFWAAANLFDLKSVRSVLPALVQQISLRVNEMKPQGLSNSLWAVAQLQDAAPEVLQTVPALVARIPLKTRDTDPRHLSNNMWAAAKLQDAAPEVLKIVPSVVGQVPVRAASMNPQDLSNCLWAAVQLRDSAPEVLKIVPALVAQIESKAGGMSEQHLSNSLWAAAQLQDAATEVLKIVPALVEQIRLKAPNMIIPQHLSNSLWAAAKLQDAAPEVVKVVPALAAQIPFKAVGMIPQHLSNSLWALKDFPASTALAKGVLALVEEIPSKINCMDAQELSNTTQALVFLGESLPIDKQPEMIAASAEQLNRILPGLKGKDLMFTAPVVIWACGRSNVYDANLFTAVAGRFSSRRAVSSLPDWGVCALHLGCTLLLAASIWR